MERQRNGKKAMRTKEVYSQFVSIHCPGLSQFPRAPTTIAPILFVVFVIVFALQFLTNLSKKQSFGATNEEFSL